MTAAELGPDGQPMSALKMSPERLAGGVKPYALTDHIHKVPGWVPSFMTIGR